MNINQAKYILTILSEGSFSAAANKLFLSQSALSQTVHAVEQSIGGNVCVYAQRRAAEAC